MRSIAAVLLLLFCYELKASDEVSLAVVTEEWRPFNYTDDNGIIVGRSTTKVRAILDSLGYKYDIRSYPWTRAMRMAENDENTLIYSIFRTPEREHKYQWACPLMAPVKVYFFHLATRDDINVTSLDDAKNYVISVGRNARSHETLLEKGFIEGQHLDVSADPSGELRKFLAGRVDFLVQSEWEMSESLKGVERQYIEVVRSLEVANVNERSACIAFSKKTDKEIVNRVQAALDKYNKKFDLE